MRIAPRVSSPLRLLLAAGCALVGARADAQHYTQTNLVSDQSGAAVLDANLKNPWGLSRSSTSPWWVANNGTGTSTLYNGSTGAPAALIVTVPPISGSGDGVPTGTVFNFTSGFELTPGNPARFLFVTEDGTISGWNPAVDPTHAVIKARNRDAVYKGAAIALRNGAPYLYVANFAGRRIDVFDSRFHRVTLAGAADAEDRRLGDEDISHGGPRFQDERVPRGFAPFNVQNVGGRLFVTFAKRDPATNDDVKGAGLGYVDVFSAGGRLLQRFEHGDWMNAPWGVALAPGDFGAFSHNVLVGQFGSGEIAAFDAVSGEFLGRMREATTQATLKIDGLWALSFGNGAAAGPLNSLFFTAGLDEEAHGLFGSLTAVSTDQPGNGR
jgi:uncharacterized protein (TIGR03118 family)